MATLITSSARLPKSSLASLISLSEKVCVSRVWDQRDRVRPRPSVAASAACRRRAQGVVMTSAARGARLSLNAGQRPGCISRWSLQLPPRYESNYHRCDRGTPVTTRSAISPRLSTTLFHSPLLSLRHFRAQKWRLAPGKSSGTRKRLPAWSRVSRVICLKND